MPGPSPTRIHACLKCAAPGRPFPAPAHTSPSYPLHPPPQTRVGYAPAGFRPQPCRHTHRRGGHARTLVALVAHVGGAEAEPGGHTATVPAHNRQPGSTFIDIAATPSAHFACYSMQCLSCHAPAVHARTHAHIHTRYAVLRVSLPRAPCHTVAPRCHATRDVAPMPCSAPVRFPLLPTHLHFHSM